MKNIHPFARTWRYILIASSAALALLLLLPPLIGNISGSPWDFVWLALIAGGISGAMTYVAVTSKIITSPEGIEGSALGISIKVTWNQVAKVEINPYGFVNLFFKEAIYPNGWMNSLLRLLTSDKTFQLSPYIDDLATSELLKDVAKYVPNSHIPEFIARNKSSAKPYQKVGAIGFYYFGCLLLMLIVALASRKGAEYLEASGLTNMTLVSYIISATAIVGLFINGMNLLGYNAEIARMNENEISHRARTHYLSPIVVLLMGLIGGLSLWAILQSLSIVSPENNFFIVSVLLGVASLRVSAMLERLIFKKDVRQAPKND